MPITQTWNPSILTNAANAENLTFDKLSKLMARIKPEDMNGFVEWAKETPVATLKDWRDAFPVQFGKLNDNEASAIIRVAMTVAGGVAV